MEITTLKIISSIVVISLSIVALIWAQDIASPYTRWKKKKEEFVPCKKCGLKFIIGMDNDTPHCPHCDAPYKVSHGKK